MMYALINLFIKLYSVNFDAIKTSYLILLNFSKESPELL